MSIPKGYVGLGLAVAILVCGGHMGGHAVVAEDVTTGTPAGENRRVGAEGALGQADGGGRLAHQGGKFLRYFCF